MKRGGPLRRKRPLKRASELPQGTTRVRRRGPVTRQIAKMDRLFSELIRHRDKTCQARVAKECSGSFRLQCAHIIPRRYKVVRWLPENAVALCWRCHAYFTMNPVQWELWIMDRLGMGDYRILLQLATSGQKADLDATLERLEDEHARAGLARGGKTES